MASPAEAIRINGLAIDLSGRFVQSTTVAASPALAAETTICTITLPSNAAQASGIQLWGFAAFTVGTTGSAVNLRIRQTSTAGTLISSTGAVTAGVAAAALMAKNVQGFDTAGTLPGQVYVLTLQVTGGTAASTVSAAQLTALIV